LRHSDCDFFANSFAGVAAAEHNIEPLLLNRALAHAGEAVALLT